MGHGYGFAVLVVVLLLDVLFISSTRISAETKQRWGIVRGLAWATALAWFLTDTIVAVINS